MSEFFVLKSIDLALHEATRKISFLAINPNNITEEKQKVFADENYNPQFRYGNLPHDPDKVEEELNAVDDHDSVLGSLLAQKRDVFIDKCEMMRRIGTSKFNVFAKKVCGFPKASTLARAAELMSFEPQNEESAVSTAQAVNLIRAELIHYGFPYMVKQKEMSSLAAVSVADQCVFVRKDATFSHRYIQRLIVHEIGTHVLRAENGRAQPFWIFFSGFPQYLATEEGLAVFNEERFGLLTAGTMRLYAARAIAVKMGQDRSFSKTYKYFRGRLGDDAAFKLALRVKRGLADTSKRGGFPKDFVYLEGYLAVKKFLEDNGKDNGTMQDLYYGKIGVDHVPLLAEVTGLSRPRFLPKNQGFADLTRF
ncbi:DUF1704 domain-containing protein [Candidatus Woesearchaeota archaeon]|nr:DUF1704 domain-containing protein [Candidatus Woesearchaeota archaeon]